MKKDIAIMSIGFFYRTIIFLFLLSLGQFTFGNLTLQPIDVVTDIPTAPGSSPFNVVDQSGLSASYVSLETTWAWYLDSAPTHNFAGAATIWNGFNNPLMLPGNFDFDLGGTYVVESFAMWNFGGGQDANVVGFTLLADDNPGFSTPAILGSYSADPDLGPTSAVNLEEFTFAPTEAAYIRMQITSNFGDNANVVFGEAVFGVSQVVPEPSAAIVFVILAASVNGSRRKK